eukprot:TRINITY_DN12145_c0_g2_i1.p2 TRINITY_DN12145_c0_g2~~TRINITY_DN12145_c0_g2_i1.p2  ORF type:complete len:210 (+),score=75.67 TRINITY_DN12145_c0_g2_i1:768-1397(+)
MNEDINNIEEVKGNHKADFNSLGSISDDELKSLKAKPKEEIKEQSKQRKCRYCINEVSFGGAECTQCSKAACEDCRKPNNFLPLNKHSMKSIPSSAFSKNEFEQKVLKEYLDYQGMNMAELSKELMAKIVRSGWMNGGKELKQSDVLCVECYKKVWNELVYEYRRNINETLPKKVKDRKDCWYGRDCTTQVHNQDHAKRYNHVCPNMKK